MRDCLEPAYEELLKSWEKQAKSVLGTTGDLPRYIRAGHPEWDLQEAFNDLWYIFCHSVSEKKLDAARSVLNEAQALIELKSGNTGPGVRVRVVEGTLSGAKVIKYELA